MPKVKKSVSFEDSLQKLEKSVEQLESGTLSLEESLSLFEDGIRLSRQCNRFLEEADKRIEMILKNERGEYIQEVLPIEESDL